MEGYVHKQCGTDDGAVRATQTHKPATIIVTVVKTILPRYMSEQGVIRAHVGIGTMSPVGRTLLKYVQLLSLGFPGDEYF